MAVLPHGQWRLFDEAREEEERGLLEGAGGPEDGSFMPGGALLDAGGFGPPRCCRLAMTCAELRPSTGSGSIGCFCRLRATQGTPPRALVECRSCANMQSMQSKTGSLARDAAHTRSPPSSLLAVSRAAARAFRVASSLVRRSSLSLPGLGGGMGGGGTDPREAAGPDLIAHCAKGVRRHVR